MMKPFFQSHERYMSQINKYKLAHQVSSRQFWDFIDWRLESVEKPTIGHLLSAICEESDAKFDPNYMLHDIIHYSARNGLTLQHEMLAMETDKGAVYGCRVTRMDQDQVKTFLEENDQRVAHEIYLTKRDWHADVVPVSSKQRAVSFALGMYMRQKMEAYKEAGMETKSYEEQKRFCEDYAENDQLVSEVTGNKIWPQWAYDHMLEAPLALATLSGENPDLHAMRIKQKRSGLKTEQAESVKNTLLARGERGAITAVALGLCEPEETAYPNRLGAIKKALVHLSFFHDLKNPSSVNENRER